MALTDYQIKNPLKQTGKNSISYVERSFLNGNIEEIQQWYDTGIIHRIMSNGVRTYINYSEHLGTALLNGAKSGKLTENECLYLWKQLWESGGKNRTENLDTWVKDARGSTLDFLVANGANPNATFYNFYGATNLVIQLISERKSSSYPPTPTDTSNDERILEFIKTQPPATQKLLDDTLAQVLRAFHFDDTDSDKNIYNSWRDALLEKGANPLTDFMSKLSLSLKTIDSPMSSSEVREYLLTLGDLPHAQAKEKITQEEHRRSEKKRTELIEFITPVFKALPDKISTDIIDIYQWTDILSVKGMGTISKILIDKGACPWQTKTNTHDETISILLGYSQKRNYKVLRGLKEIKNHPRKTNNADWFTKALLPYVKVSTENGKESMLTADDIDTLHDIVRSIPSTDSKHGISTRFNLLAEAWFKEITASPHFNEAHIGEIIQAWRKYGVPQFLSMNILDENQSQLVVNRFQLIENRNKLNTWMHNADYAEILTKYSQIKHPGMFKFLMALGDNKAPLHVTTQYLKQALNENKNLEDSIISEVTNSITTGSEPDKILAYLEVINQAGGKTSIENSNMDLRDTVTTLVNMGCSSSYSPHHIEGISRNLFEMTTTLDATEMLDTMITYEHSLAAMSQLPFFDRTSGCIPMMNVLISMGADPTAIKIYERGGAVSAALKDILLMKELDQNTLQAGNKNNKKLRL